jgi:phage protein D
MAATNLVAGGLASFDVQIDGKSVDASILVARIDVLTSFSDPGRAMIIIENEQSGGVSGAGGESFPMGGKLSIALGYDGQTSRVFYGTIDALGARSSRHEPARLQVEAIEDTAERPAVGDQSALVLTYGETILEMDLTRGAKPTVGGEVSTMGTTTVQPGQRVTLTGLGPTFNGDARVSCLQHTVDAGQWTTTLQLGLPDDAPEPF